MNASDARSAPRPFSLHVPDDVLADLRERLGRVRWPDEPPPPLEPWSTGTSLAYMKDLVAWWRDGFDWRAHEAELNRWRQFKVRLGDTFTGIDLHFIHEEGKGPDPMPLLLMHGWPGSVVEFRRLLPMLTDPARFGADPADAFTVVAPSLPGYTLSFTPGQRRIDAHEMATMFDGLMREVLGYPRYGLQGGDWGATIASRMGYACPEPLIGMHLNFLAAVRRDPKMIADPTPEERTYLEQLEHFLNEETGYQWIQGTRPTTLAYGLTDSPVGLAAWIVEKFFAWTDNDGIPESAVGRDDILADITLYWVTGAIGSSFWPYYARRRQKTWVVPEGERIGVPTGYVGFPREILRPPRSLAERSYADIRRWTVAEKGGHFAALEQPEVLAREVREFFRPLRG